MPFCCAVSCQKPIIFAKHKTSGNNNPLDLSPSPDGNLLVARHSTGLVYEVLSGDELEQAQRQGVELYISHFATCPARACNQKKETPAAELLASASTKATAEDLAHATSQRFHRRVFVGEKPEERLPFQIVTDAELTPGTRRQIKRFIGEYVAKLRICI